ncbi:MAG: hypothetical protein RR808_06660 [Akkermansia sp.]
MQKKYILSTALAVASFAGVALAGTKAAVMVPATPVVAPVATAFSGSATVGYSSNYDFRGLILEGANGGNMTPVQVATKYDLNDVYAITMGAGYKAMWNKDQNSSMGEHDFQNEFNYNLGVQAKWVKGLTTSFNYNLFHGGTPGYVARMFENAAHSVTQEFGVGAMYDFGTVGVKGLFAAANINYSFAGVTGWWYTTTVGYQKQINERVSAVLSASWNATSSYFSAKSEMANGSQAFDIRLEVPVTLCKHVSFVPFVGTYWAGSSALKVNRGNDGEHTFRNFTVMAGANLVYTF